MNLEQIEKQEKYQIYQMIAQNLYNTNLVFLLSLQPEEFFKIIESKKSIQSSFVLDKQVYTLYASIEKESLPEPPVEIPTVDSHG